MSAMPRSDDPRSRKLPLPLTLLGVLLAPRHTGRHLARRTLVSALAVHLCVIVVLVLTLRGVMGALESSATHKMADRSMLSLWRGFSAGLVRAMSTGSYSFTTTTASLVLLVLVEVYYWSIGLVVMGPYLGIAAPQRRQLSRAAVATGFASVWVVPLTGCWLAGLLLFSRALGVGGSSPAWGEIGQSLCFTIAPAAMFCMTLRMARGMGETLTSDWREPDKLCEFCGYNLHATPFAQRCPECGTSAAISLSTIYRCNPWELGRAGFIRAWLSILWNPRRFFRTIRVRTRTAPARRFLMLSSIVSAVTFAALVFLGRWINLPGSLARQPLSRLYDHAAFAIALGGLWGIAAPAVSMMTASVLNSGSRNRRDAINGPGALKITCYLSALSTPFAIVSGLVLATIGYLRSHGVLGGPGDTTVMFIWMIVLVVLLSWYWFVGGRAYESCRYSNT